MVTFWATSCVGCRREVPHLVDLYEKYRDRGFELVAVAMAYDPPEQVLRFRNDKQLPYRVALDLDGAAAHAFDDVSLTPTTFVIAADGRIAFQTIGEFDTGAMENLISSLLQQG
jgi:peroxiredoxin